MVPTISHPPRHIARQELARGGCSYLAEDEALLSSGALDVGPVESMGDGKIWGKDGENMGKSWETVGIYRIIWENHGKNMGNV